MPSVDQRVVEMQFDNAQFERGARQSMDTINELEKSLVFKDGTKGLDAIAQAVSSFDFSNMQRGVDAIASRFSTLGIVGQTIIQRLTNEAMNALQGVAAKLGSAYSIVKEGGKARAENLEQARFMLKGLTGDMKTVDKIITGTPKKMGPVMAAVDGTRFGLDEAAVAASNLYASGITNMDKLERSLKSISGAATMTNKEYGDMAQIFSTVASNGFLMTMQVRQFSTYGMNVLALLKEYLKETKGIEMSEQEIGDKLKDGFITYEMFADAMYKYWDLAADANTTYSGSLKNVQAQLKKIGAEVYSVYLEKMIPVNNALIVYLKELKKELAPLFKIINGNIIRTAKLLVDTINDPRIRVSSIVLIDSVVKGYKLLMKTLKPIKKAFRDVFPDVSILSILTKITIGINNFVKSLKPLDKQLTRQIFTGLFSMLKNTIENVKMLFQIMQPIGERLGALADVIFRVFAVIGNKIGVFVKDMDEAGSRAKVVDTITAALDRILPSAEKISEAGDKVIEFLKKTIPSFKEVQEVVERVIDILSNFKDRVKDAFSFIPDISWTEKVADAFTRIIDKFNELKNDVIGTAKSVYETLKTIGKFIVDVVGALAEQISPALADLGKQIGDFIKTARLADLLDILKLFVTAGIGEEIYTMLTRINDATNGFVHLPSTLNSTLWTIKNNFEVMNKVLGAGAVMKIAEAIAILAGSLFVLASVPADKLTNAGLAITGLFEALVINFKLLKGFGLYDIQLFHTGAALLVLASAIGILSLALKGLAKEDPEKLAQGFVFLIAEMTLLIAGIEAIGVLCKGMGPDMLAGAAAMMILAVALQMTGAALAIFSALDPEKTGNGLKTMAIALIEMVAAVAILAKVGPMVIVSAASLLIVANALVVLGGAVAIFAQLPITEVWQGLVTLGAALVGIVLALIGLSKAGPMILVGAAALAIVAPAILVLAGALAALSAIDFDSMCNALVAMASALIIVGGGIAMLSMAGPMLLVASGSLLIAAAAIGVLSASMAILSMVPAGAIFANLSAIAGGMVLIGVAAIAVAGATPVLLSFAACCLGLAAAVLAVTGGIALLGVGLLLIATAGESMSRTNWVNVAGGLVALAAGLAALAIVATQAPLVVVGLGLLAATLVVLELAMVGLAAVVTLLGLGMSILTPKLEEFSKISFTSVISGFETLKNCTKNLETKKVSEFGDAMVKTATSSEVLYDMLPYVTSALSRLYNTIVQMADTSSSISFEPLSVAFVKLKNTIDETTTDVNQPVADLTDSFKQLAQSGEKIAAVSDKVVAMANAMDTLYFKTPDATEAIRKFCLRVSDTSKYLDDVNFDNLEDSMSSLSDVTGKAVGYSDSLTYLANCFKDLASVDTIIAPFTQHIVDIANSIKTLDEKTNSATNNLILFSGWTEKLQEKIAVLDMSALARTISDLNTKLSETVDRTAGIDAIYGALFNLSTLSEQIAPIADRIVGMGTAMYTMKNELPNVTSKLTLFADKLTEISGAVEKVRFDVLNTELDRFATHIQGVVDGLSSLQMIYDLFYNIGKQETKLKNIGEHLSGITNNLVQIKNVASIAKGNLSAFCDEAYALDAALQDAFDLGYLNANFTRFADLVDADASRATSAIKTLAENLVGNFKNGLAKQTPAAETAISTFNNRVVEKFGKLKDLMVSPGANAIDGFIRGMHQREQKLYNEAYKMGLKARKGAMDALDEHSPSKVFAKIGAWAVDGFVIGIEKGTAKAQRSVTKLMKKLVKIADGTVFSFDENEAMGKALEALEEARSKTAGALKNLKATKDSIKMVNHELKEYSTIQTKNKKLTNNQQAEMLYLQKKLKVEGSLSDAEMKRLGRLLGLNKKETDALKNQLKQRTNLNKTLQENRKEYQKLKKLSAEIEKEVFNHKAGDPMGFGSMAETAVAASEALESYAKKIYKASDAYKEHRKEQKLNRETIKDLKKDIKKLREERDKEGKNIDHTEKRLKKLLEGRKTSIKLDKSEQKELKHLQEKLERRGKLSDEEYLKLAKLLGIKGDNLNKIKAEIKLLDDQNAVYDQYTQDIQDSKAAILELRQANKDLSQTIKDETVDALADLHATIKNNVTDALKPLNSAMRDSIDLFGRFSTTTVDFELPYTVSTSEDDEKKAAKIGELAGKGFRAAVIEKLKDESTETIDHYLSMSSAEVEKVNKSVTDQLIGNVASFGLVFEEWKGVMAQIENMDFAQGIKDRLYALGPEALELAKMYLGMTNEEIKKANEATLATTHATAEEWLMTWENKMAQQKQFAENLDILATMGLDSRLIQELASQGYDAAGAYVEGLLAAPDLIERANTDLAESLKIPDSVAGQAVLAAAAAGAGAGNAYFDSLCKAFGEGVVKTEDVDKAKEGVKTFTKVITKTLYTTSKDSATEAGTQTGTVYIDGMSYAIDDNGYLVTDAASDVAEDAKEGTEQYLSKANGEYIGKQMDNGLISGLYAYGGAVAAAARAVAYQAYTAAMEELLVGSPSKKFAEIGMYADLGFAQGLSAYAGAVKAATEGVASGSLDSMREALAGISDELTNADNTPVIKPILDLSNVSRGAIEMKRMFDATHVNASMTSEGEAGADADETKSGSNYTFVQNNYSPKELSRIDIYRQTKNQFAMLKGATS